MRIFNSFFLLLNIAFAIVAAYTATKFIGGGGGIYWFSSGFSTMAALLALVRLSTTNRISRD